MLKEPKDRILDAAAILFGNRGYSAVGVREIAKEADVNISMISYYFNGKIGILKAIIESYFIELEKILKEVVDSKLTRDEKTRLMFRKHIELIKSNTALFKVALVELPFEVPEIAEYKSKLFLTSFKLIKEAFHKDNAAVAQDPALLAIIGPAVLSLIFSQFLFGHIVKSISDVELNDEFFLLYSETISTLFLDGVHGLAAKKIKKNSD